ncbi:MAG: YigZ family protein [Vicingaceae bacterium]
MNPSNSYKTITVKSEGIYKEKGSKFLAYAFPVKSEDEIINILESLKNEHPQSRHICYAYVLGANKERFRVNDDGEPSGTAGKQIYGQILSKDITNVLVAVVRYFGGTKLGVSGLINAYKEAANNALENNTISTVTLTNHYKIEFSYELRDKVKEILLTLPVNHLIENFLETCELFFESNLNADDEAFNYLKSIDGIKFFYLGHY